MSCQNGASAYHDAGPCRYDATSAGVANCAGLAAKTTPAIGASPDEPSKSPWTNSRKFARVSVFVNTACAHASFDGTPASLTAHASRLGSKPSTSIQSWSISPVAYASPGVSSLEHQGARRISA